MIFKKSINYRGILKIKHLLLFTVSNLRQLHANLRHAEELEYFIITPFFAFLFYRKKSAFYWFALDNSFLIILSNFEH